MPITAHGITVEFGSSNFTAEITNFTAPGSSRESIPTTHAGTTDAKTFMPGDLPDNGELALTVHFDEDEEPPIDGDPEQVTITFVSGTTWTFSFANSSTARGMVPSLARVLARFRANWSEQFDASRLRIVRSELDAEHYLRAGERCLENGYRRLYPFDDETLGLERKVEFALDSAGDYAVRGVIDRLVRARDGALEIHDYKTGRRIPSQDELDRDRQLALYEIGVRAALREEGEVRLVWHYLLQNQVRTSTRTPEQLAALREATCRTIDRIRAEEAWDARPGKLCAWCEYRSICPAFGGRPAEAPADVEPEEAE